MPWKQWAFLEKVPSADFQSYLQNQVVATFTNTTQRDSVYTAAPPTKGALCITTDTMTKWVWTGTQWVQAPWSTAWGLIAPPVASTADTSSGGAGFVSLTGCVVTATLVANRKVRMDSLVNFNGDAAGQQASLRGLFNGVALGNVVSGGVGGFVSQGYAPVAGSLGRTAIPYIGFAVTVAGVNTFQMQGNRVGGVGVNATFMGGALLSVTDVGPAGPPA